MSDVTKFNENAGFSYQIKKGIANKDLTLNELYTAMPLINSVAEAQVVSLLYQTKAHDLLDPKKIEALNAQLPVPGPFERRDVIYDHIIQQMAPGNNALQLSFLDVSLEEYLAWAEMKAAGQEGSYDERVTKGVWDGFLKDLTKEMSVHEELAKPSLQPAAKSKSWLKRIFN